MSKFYVWIEDNNVSNSTISESDFEKDTQRKNGFVAGRAASALRTNTALRQANLVAIALIEALASANPSQADALNNLNAQSKLIDVMNAIKNTNLFKLSSIFLDVKPENFSTMLRSSIYPVANTNISLGDSGNKFLNIWTNDLHADSLHLNGDNYMGSTSQPIYFANGYFSNCGFTIKIANSDPNNVVINFVVV